MSFYHYVKNDKSCDLLFGYGRQSKTTYDMYRKVYCIFQRYAWLLEKCNALDFLLSFTHVLQSLKKQQSSYLPTTVDAEYADRFLEQSRCVDSLLGRHFCTECWLPWHNCCWRHRQTNVEITINVLLVLSNNIIKTAFTLLYTHLGLYLLSPHFLPIHYAHACLFLRHFTNSFTAALHVKSFLRSWRCAFHMLQAAVITKSNQSMLCWIWLQFESVLKQNIIGSLRELRLISQRTV